MIDKDNQDKGYLGVLDGLIINPILEDGDYIKNGLLHCGKCNTPKQMHLDIDLGEDEPIKRIVPIPCKCRQQEIDKLEAEKKAREAREKAERWRKEGLSETAWHKAQFKNDDRRDGEASELCKRYCDNFEQMATNNMGLMMYGGLGSGKTFLAACMANELIDKGIAVLMVSLPTLVARITEDYGNNRLAVLEQVQDIPLLIIDDLGIEHDTDYMVGQIYELINTRYKTRKPMIITTNLTMNEMMGEIKQNKQRIFDRIFEMCAPVFVKGGSRRENIAKEKQNKLNELLGFGNN